MYLLFLQNWLDNILMFENVISHKSRGKIYRWWWQMLWLIDLSIFLFSSFILFKGIETIVFLISMICTIKNLCWKIYLLQREIWKTSFIIIMNYIVALSYKNIFITIRHTWIKLCQIFVYFHSVNQSGKSSSTQSTNSLRKGKGDW